MSKKTIVVVITLIAGLSGLGGLSLLGQIGEFPNFAKVIIINSIVFRGFCGLIGGVLLWRGNKWGYRLTLICWIYLILTSVLTINQLYSGGLILSYEFLQQNYAAFGRPFLISILKIVLGIPIIHFVISYLLNPQQDTKQGSLI